MNVISDNTVTHLQPSVQGKQESQHIEAAGEAKDRRSERDRKAALVWAQQAFGSISGILCVEQTSLPARVWVSPSLRLVNRTRSQIWKALLRRALGSSEVIIISDTKAVD